MTINEYATEVRRHEAAMARLMSHHEAQDSDPLWTDCEVCAGQGNHPGTCSACLTCQGMGAYRTDDYHGF